MNGDSNLLFSSVEEGLTVGLIATYEPRCCGADDDLKDVVGNEDLREFDYVPVKEGKEIVGLLHRAAHDTKDATGPVRGAMCRLRGDLIISADAGILSYVEDADKRPCRLVLRGSRFDGIVTLSDLQKLPVRPALFLLITHVELLMAEWIRTKDLTGREILDKLCETRRSWVESKWKGLQKRNLAIDILSATDFIDKRKLLQQLDFPVDNSEMAGLKLVEFLRHSLAHAGDYALILENAQKTIEAVRHARDWIGHLQHALKTPQ